jgi:hypothetical protein
MMMPAVGSWKFGLSLLPLSAVAALLAIQPSPAAESAVDLALVLTTDISYSVDRDEARFQSEGTIAAFRSPEVVKAIQSGALGRIAVAYIVFGSRGQERVLIDWKIIHDQASAEMFANALAERPLPQGLQTSISSGLELATRLIETSGIAATRKVIDVSGDGPNNDGKLVVPVRDEAIAKGVTINGLPIVTEADKFDVYYLPDLDKFYAGCVIGGPHAFIQVAHGFEDFARAIRRKLVFEISDSGHAPSQNPNIVKVAARVPGDPSRTAPVYEKGCDIGERMRYGAGPP